MKRFRWMMVLILSMVSLQSAFAQQRIIVRDNLGLGGLKITCLLVNCKVGLNLGDPSGQLFVITVNNSVNLNSLLTNLLNQIGIVDAEVDNQLTLVGTTAGPVPESLLNNTPLTYYGAPVWNGYVNQPASGIIRVQETQTTFHVAGAGTVAMIDTGVDTKHPALSGVLVPGYNFINDTPSGDETGDVDESSAAVLDGAEPNYVNSSTVAVVSESSAAVLDGGDTSDFGHGTMTAGVVHLVAPRAKIMPLKAFGADGTGYVSNIIRATYYAAQHGGKVLSMSFSFGSTSNEMVAAVNYANSRGLICVAAAGNDGEDVQVYPAAQSHVMGVAATTDTDARSSYSNYGSDVWLAAPGDNIVSTYPYGTYASASGTSFSTPFVSGTAALMVGVSGTLNQTSAAAAFAHAKWISDNGMGNGRLDTYLALQSWIAASGQ